LSASPVENESDHPKCLGGRLSSAHTRLEFINKHLNETQKRKKFLDTMRVQAEETAFKDLFVRPPDTLGIPQLRQRTRSSGTMGSRASIVSCYTTASLGTETDDDDTRQLRRLFRKTEARLCGAWDQIDQVMIWLRIVKETLRGVKREAYI
jgi:hypothetical protein